MEREELIYYLRELFYSTISENRNLKNDNNIIKNIDIDDIERYDKINKKRLSEKCFDFERLIKHIK